MSQKITSKNLSYNATLPPFLAKLQSQASGHPGPDPVVAGQRRSAKKRSGSEEAEDTPLVVDEQGNVVSLNVDKDGVIKESESKAVTDDYDVRGETEDGARKGEPDGRAAIGGRKRKVGKVIGEAADEQPEKTDPKRREKDAKTAEGSVSKKTKKKVKKIKLSFDEEEEAG